MKICTEGKNILCRVTRHPFISTKVLQRSSLQTLSQMVWVLRALSGPHLYPLSPEGVIGYATHPGQDTLLGPHTKHTDHSRSMTM